MKRALFWEKRKNYVKCNLCPHNCSITEGKRGICNTRENRKGILYSMNYGRVVAMSIDPIEKKPLYHFYPGSKIFSYSCWGCNFSCDFCQNWEISQKETDAPIVSPNDMAKAAEGTLGVAHTYTEPTVFYEYALEISKIVHKKGLKNVFVSNGFINKEPMKRLAPHIDAANIDMKSFDPEFYRKVCSGSLEPVMKTIELMKRRKIWVEITNLLIPGMNDDLLTIKKMCEWIAGIDPGIPLHFSAFHPDYKMLDATPTPLKILEKAKEVGKRAGLKYIYLGNVHYDQNTYCYKCNFPLVERDYMFVKKINMSKAICPKCGSDQEFVF
jgi:pyruvate formate lyase activating enzyme